MDEGLGSSECVVIVTDHHTGMDLRLVVHKSPRILDLRNAVRRLGERSNGPFSANVDVLSGAQSFENGG